MAASSWKEPSTALVLITEFCFSTPRIVMHRCWHSITTPTPSAPVSSRTARAMSLVSRSWICSRAARQSTIRAILLTPSTRPREILGIAPECIRVGAPANLILVDTEQKWTVDPEKLHSKSHNTAFRGMELTGKVKMTITDGKIRFEDK